jgi:hypothetical protein
VNRLDKDSKSRQLDQQNVEKAGHIRYIRRTTHKSRTRKLIHREDALSKETLPTATEALNQESTVAQTPPLKHENLQP